MNDNIKNEKLKGISTEAIRRILERPRTQGERARSQSHPLGGLVHIEGIGQVSLNRLRAVLRDREATA